MTDQIPYPPKGPGLDELYVPPSDESVLAALDGLTIVLGIAGIICLILAMAIFLWLIMTGGEEWAHSSTTE